MTSVCFLMSCTTAMSHTQLPHLAQEYRRSPHGSSAPTHMNLTTLSRQGNKLPLVCQLSLAASQNAKAGLNLQVPLHAQESLY